MTASSISPDLLDIVPWSVERPSTVVVCDTLESDGRFVGYHLALQALKADHKVLWLQGGPLTEALVLRSFRKLGRDQKAIDHHPIAIDGLTTSNGGVPGHDQSLSVRCLAVELTDFLLQGDKVCDVETEATIDLELFLKTILRQVKDWLFSAGDTPWIILDDVSTFAALVGDVLAYQFLLSLHSLVDRAPTGLYIRCAGDRCCDAGLIDSFGAGGKLRNRQAIPSLEGSIIELADHVIDVVSLAGGPTRDIHGRLLFTSHGNDNGVQSNMCNFSLQENKVTAIRVRR